MLTWQIKTRKDRNIRYEHRRQFLLTGAVYKMKENQNTYAVIDTDHLHSWIYSTFVTFSLIAEKTGRCREVILANRDTFQWPSPLWWGLNNSKGKFI